MASVLDGDDVALGPGDHVCGFYYGDDERDAVLLPFLGRGLADGDKCLGVVDSTSPDDLVVALGQGRAATVDLDASLASGQLELYGSDETYLSGGSFDAGRMIDFWERRAEAEQALGRFGFARVVGEMSWLERVPPRRDELVRYESWADGFAARFPHAVLCLYDLRRLGSEVMLDLLRTHPKLLLRGLLVENPHHLSGDEFVAART